MAARPVPGSGSSWRRRRLAAAGRRWLAGSAAVLLVAVGVTALTGRPAGAVVRSAYPWSQILTPAAGTRLAVGEVATVTGSAFSGEAGRISAVDVSVDGGTSWGEAQLVGWRWSYSFTPTDPGPILLVSRAHGEGDTEAPIRAVRVVIGTGDRVDALGCPCDLWFNDLDYPPVDDPDDQPVELGVRFRASVAGRVTGVRFLKFAENVGVHLGRLWSESGQLLAEASFTSESDTGWQTTTFDAPVPVEAGRVYIASYYAPAGHYASTEDNFTCTDFVSAPLATVGTLTASSATGAGVYHYGVDGGFPADSWHDSNYWVSPVFGAAGGPAGGSS